MRKRLLSRSFRRIKKLGVMPHQHVDIINKRPMLGRSNLIDNKILVQTYPEATVDVFFYLSIFLTMSSFIPDRPLRSYIVA
jgi:hypothetical protein